MKKELIAPCGLNCGVCQHHLRADNRCPGCRTGRLVNGHLINCARRNCTYRSGFFCFECVKFPCDSLRRLEKRYQSRYGISSIDNLVAIQTQGLASFMELETQRWVNADGVLCMHDRKRYPQTKDE